MTFVLIALIVQSGRDEGGLPPSAVQAVFALLTALQALLAVACLLFPISSTLRLPPVQFWSDVRLYKGWGWLVLSEAIAKLGGFLDVVFLSWLLVAGYSRPDIAAFFGVCAAIGGSLALAFCVFNGWLQGRLWTALQVHAAPTTVADAACFGLGCMLWVVGFAINLHADAVLRGLRKTPGDTNYYVPRGGAFEYVSAANYFGEFVEWCGYALAARHVAAYAFAYFTFCNLAPRAKHHHEWYQKKIDGYPASRKAMLPFVW